ncbi:Uncharacterised protein [uncultured archaeon]|nr:Uncharacterised protein [uncultured archaeon]
MFSATHIACVKTHVRDFPKNYPLFRFYLTTSKLQEIPLFPHEKIVFVKQIPTTFKKELNSLLSSRFNVENTALNLGSIQYRNSGLLKRTFELENLFPKNYFVRSTADKRVLKGFGSYLEALVVNHLKKTNKARRFSTEEPLYYSRRMQLKKMNLPSTFVKTNDLLKGLGGLVRTRFKK